MGDRERTFAKKAALIFVVAVQALESTAQTIMLSFFLFSLLYISSPIVCCFNFKPVTSRAGFHRVFTERKNSDDIEAISLGIEIY